MLYLVQFRESHKWMYEDLVDHKCIYLFYLFILSTVDGLFDPWMEWGECSESCGDGIRLRHRTCDGPYSGGRNCSGDWTDIGDCNLRSCPGAVQRHFYYYVITTEIFINNNMFSVSRFITFNITCET